jgi:hypothetical protein
VQYCVQPFSSPAPPWIFSTVLKPEFPLVVSHDAAYCALLAPAALHSTISQPRR